MTDAQAQLVSYIPSCSQQTHLRQYNAADAAAYNPEHGGYYAHKVPVMLPGAIIGAICLVAALAFLLWVRQRPGKHVYNFPLLNLASRVNSTS